MIVLDIETGGLNPRTKALLSIGAVDFNNGDEFYIECCAFDDSEVDDRALVVNGFTRQQALDKSKPTRLEAYISFQKWCVGRDTLIAGQQVGSFDLAFLKEIQNDIDILNSKDFLSWQFGHRSVDLHSIAYARFGKSLSLDGILQALGLEPEPKPHNALVGAKLEAEAFRRLLNR